jgi:hypothetical protein
MCVLSHLLQLFFFVFSLGFYAACKSTLGFRDFLSEIPQLRSSSMNDPSHLIVYKPCKCNRTIHWKEKQKTRTLTKKVGVMRKGNETTRKRKRKNKGKIKNPILIEVTRSLLVHLSTFPSSIRFRPI